jgi:murein DD-endopeptidase MepM/ murein hydrolase activator NlpD
MKMIPMLILSLQLTNFHCEIHNSLPIRIEWQSLGENIRYELQLSFTEDFEDIQFSYPETSNTYWDIYSIVHTRYYARIRYNEVGSSSYYFKFVGCFEARIAYEPEPQQPIVYNPPQNEVGKIEEISLFNEKDSIAPSVLGIDTMKETSSDCLLYILENNGFSILDFKCNLGINLNRIIYRDWDNYYSLDIQGVYLERINPDVLIFQCKAFTLLDPDTWFKCKYILKDSLKENISLIYTTNVVVNNVIYKNQNFIFKKDSFSTNTIFKEDIYNKKAFLNTKTFISFKRNKWIDLEYISRSTINIPKAEKMNIEKRPFTFPLDRNIGVTQWYGCTKYQCPHKGIDFGARLNRVVSIGDGKVVKVGFDKYGGECNQGGNYVIIHHSNGMYSTYFHLDHYTVRVNDSVKKGSVIGISGNSGKWNCQNLGYHLHFETRKNINSSSHTNPVPHIAIDWNLIPTIGADKYPDRLSGENPHPNF